jgi:hypothetical protein
VLIDKLIRQALASVLVDQITYTGKVVPVFNNVPDNHPMPYIEIIGQNTAVRKANKDRSEFTCNVPIRVMTNSIAGAGGDLQGDDIEQQIIDKTEVLAITGYSIIQSSYSSQSFYETQGRERQVHKILNFFYTIIKN